MVAEYLNKRGVKGFFYILLSLIYKKILPVHQMHIILSKINLDIVHKKFLDFVQVSMKKIFINF